MHVLRFARRARHGTHSACAYVHNRYICSQGSYGWHKKWGSLSRPCHPASDGPAGHSKLSAIGFLTWASYIIVSADSISRDGPDTPGIYVMHYKNQKISESNLVKFLTYIITIFSRFPSYWCQEHACKMIVQVRIRSLKNGSLSFFLSHFQG